MSQTTNADELALKTADVDRTDAHEDRPTITSGKDQGQLHMSEYKNEDGWFKINPDVAIPENEWR